MRRDFQLISRMVSPDSRVIDIGCNDGQLLDFLILNKQVSAHGIEINKQDVQACAKKGLSVVQGNADHDLIHYPDKCYDYAISIQVLQATQHPKNVLEEMLRIAKEVIIATPNFGHWYNRYYLTLKGRMPVSHILSYQWYETPNIHFSTIRDMLDLCEELNCTVKEAHYLNNGRKMHLGTRSTIYTNLCATHAIFRLQKKEG